MPSQKTINLDWIYQHKIFDINSEEFKSADELVDYQQKDFEHISDHEQNWFIKRFADVAFQRGVSKIRLELFTRENAANAQGYDYYIRQTIKPNSHTPEQIKTVSLDEKTFKQFVKQMNVSSQGFNFEEEMNRQLQESQLMNSVSLLMLGLRGTAKQEVNLNDPLFMQSGLGLSDLNDIAANLNKQIVNSKKEQKAVEQNAFMFCDPQEMEKVLAGHKPIKSLDLSGQSVDFSESENKAALEMDYWENNHLCKHLDGNHKIEFYKCEDKKTHKSFYVTKEVSKIADNEQAFYSRFEDLATMQAFLRPAISQRDISNLKDFDTQLADMRQSEYDSLDLIGRFQKVGLQNASLSTIMGSVTNSVHNNLITPLTVNATEKEKDTDVIELEFNENGTLVEVKKDDEKITNQKSETVKTEAKEDLSKKAESVTDTDSETAETLEKAKDRVYAFYDLGRLVEIDLSDLAESESESISENIEQEFNENGTLVEVKKDDEKITNQKSETVKTEAKEDLSKKAESVTDTDSESASEKIVDAEVVDNSNAVTESKNINQNEKAENTPVLEGEINNDDQVIETELHAAPSFTEKSGISFDNGFVTPMSANVKPIRKSDSFDTEDTCVIENQGRDHKFDVLFKDSRVKQLVHHKYDDLKQDKDNSLYQAKKSFMKEHINLFKEKALSFFSGLSAMVNKKPMQDPDKAAFVGMSLDEYQSMEQKQTQSAKQTRKNGQSL